MARPTTQPRGRWTPFCETCDCALSHPATAAYRPQPHHDFRNYDQYGDETRRGQQDHDVGYSGQGYQGDMEDYQDQYSQRSQYRHRDQFHQREQYGQGGQSYGLSNRYGMNGQSGMSRGRYTGRGPKSAVVDVTRLLVYSERFFATDLAHSGTLLGAAVLAAFAGAIAGNRLLHKINLRSIEVSVAVLLVIVALGLGTGIL